MALRDQLTRFGAEATYAPAVDGTMQNPIALPGGLARADPTDAELAANTAAPGEPARYPIGVLYRADHETLDDGLCRQVRTHARALFDAGLPVRLQTINNRVRHGTQVWFMAGEDILAESVVRQTRELRRNTIAVAGVVVHQLVLHSAEFLRDQVLPRHIRREPVAAESLLARTIVYTPFESSHVHPDLVKILSECGQIWLQCQRNIEAFVSSGVPEEKIRLVQPAFDLDSPIAQIPEKHPSPPQEPRFYTIGKWEPRKDHHRLIGAFLREFRPDEPAQLFVKTSAFGDWDGYPKTPGASVAFWLRDPLVMQRGWTLENYRSRLRIHTEFFSEEKIQLLHQLSSIYVSPSHSEGWDYPAFDALLAGNELVHVGYGGSEDYAPPGALSVPYQLGPVHPGYVKQLNWDSRSVWAEYSVEDLGRVLRAAKPGVRRPTRMSLHRLNAAAAGAVMRRNVLEVAGRLGPELLAAKENAS